MPRRRKVRVVLMGSVAIAEAYGRMGEQLARLVDAFAQGALSLRCYTEQLARFARLVRRPSRGRRRHVRRVKAAVRRGA